MAVAVNPSPDAALHAGANPVHTSPLLSGCIGFSGCCDKSLGPQLPSASEEQEEEQAGIWKHILVGAGIGAAVGATVALAVTPAFADTDTFCDLICRLVLYPALLAPVGAGVGVAVYLIRREF
ncbi:MAG: hypothetical protein ACRENI_05205 [Gemmatimonadaceae bacterium]